MSDVTISYKGSSIAEMSDTSTKTLLTEGKYCEDDITVEYVKPSGGSGSALIEDTTDSAGGTIRSITTTDEVHLQSKTVTPTASQQTITPDSGYDALSQVLVGAAGGGIDLDDFLKGTAPSGVVTLANDVTQLYGYTFYYNSVMTSLSAPGVTRLGQRDFQYCSALKNVYFPELTHCGDTAVAAASIAANTVCYAFAYCNSLETVHLPKLQKCGSHMFYYCNSGKSTYDTVIVLPSIEFTGNLMFRSAKLKAVDLGPNCARINSDSFYSGTYDVVILRSATLVVAGTRDAVRNIRKLYVPSTLVSEYATASNWSTDASLRTVLPIEGSEYERYYADGTIIPAA